MEKIPLLWPDAPYTVVRAIFWVLVQAHQTSQVTFLAHLLVDLGWDVSGFVPFCNVGFDLLVHPFADFVAESCVGQIVVWRVVLYRSVSLLPCSTNSVDLRHDTTMDPNRES